MHPSKNLSAGYGSSAFTRKYEKTGDAGAFLEESPQPPKNLLTGYRVYVLSRGILPAAKLWCLFEEAPQKSASSLFSELPQKPTGIFPRGGKILPETRAKPV